MELPTFDAHCDVLMKLYVDENISFINSNQLQVTKQSLLNAGARVQCFAIYVPESVQPEQRFAAALQMVDLFYEKVLKEREMKLVCSRADIAALKEGEIGAILTLEGCDCIGQDLLKLKTLLRLGVTSVGLTWNYANLCADGALEPRGAGITSFGGEVISLLNEQAVWCDVSHLSEAAFWDTIQLAHYPIASHSNVYNLCPHPRNLKDDQIVALLKKGGVIGVTFVPQFLTKQKVASIADLLKHIDYLAGLGGENQIGFGSDFDGIDQTVNRLSSYREFQNVVNELEKQYSADFVKGILFHNFVRRYPR